MLVCPQCYSENPNNSLICQHCKTSLTHRSCPQCHRDVPLELVTCPGCGASVGTIWQVIIAQLSPDSEQGDLLTEQTNKLVENRQHKPNQTLTLCGNYLDPGHRYRLLGKEGEQPLKLLENHPLGQTYQGQVIDCQPLQKSVLEVLLTGCSEIVGDTPNGSTSSQEELIIAQWHQMGIPDLAVPYLTLKDLSPKIPRVHDAWLEDEREVILLPNRLHWQKLSDVLINQSLPLLQRVYWLNEILTLWKALSAVNCCQSLLIEDNLLLDEDQSLGLQQLYQNPPEKAPSLQDLARLWQKWFNLSRYPLPANLVILIDQVATGKLDNLAQLRLELQDLAATQQDEPDEQIEPESDSSLDFSEFSAEIIPELDDFNEESSNDSEEDSELDSEPLENSSELATDVLPMELLSLSEFGITDRGRLRPHNEDYFEISSQIRTEFNNHGQKVRGRGLYIVCDGMGGHAAGEVASKMAVETLDHFFKEHWQEQFPNHETLLKGILLANQTLYEVNQDNSSAGSGRMGTTLVMALVEDTKIAIAHVGDSRAYRITRQEGLEQLTVDHEVGQKAIQHGVDPEIAYGRPDAYQLTQALGPHDNNFIQPDIHFLEIQEDSLFLLCSDGLSDQELIENYWQEYLSPLLSSRNNLEQGLKKLLNFANNHNGHDNITAVLVRVKVQPQISVEDLG
ncbi:MAG TPA: serine/threonine protein phosphatase [Cyanothece sp. UBA12306]|nr:serine/threonine protein phosphatase [Cyanothece sp. UBA12306]